MIRPNSVGESAKRPRDELHPRFAVWNAVPAQLAGAAHDTVPSKPLKMYVTIDSSDRSDATELSVMPSFGYKSARTNTQLCVVTDASS